MVGAAAVGFVAGGVAGVAAAGPVRRTCPEDFKQQAREILRAVRQPPANDAELRQGLLSFIANFANWKNTADRTHLDVSRALVKAAHGEEPPLVVDPFAGGGSIPLEALRLGCEAFASDLNPVACLILKVMLEDIPRHGPGLAEELRRVGGEIKRAAKQELADLYPADPDGATPIAYLWARTVRCEVPNCGAEIPLMRSFWLCKKVKRKWALWHRVERCEREPPSVEFEVFEPKADKEVRGGTVTRARATCLCCGVVLPPERVRAQLAAERGGADVIFDAEGTADGWGADDGGGDAQAWAGGAALSAAQRRGLRGGAKGSGTSSADSGGMGAGRETGVLPGAG